MPIYKPSELMQFLGSLGISPKRALSQNFLIDGNILRKICKVADVQPGDLVLEIGPGPGSLTETLLKAGARVVAVEKDPLLAKALERLQTDDLRLTVFCADILDFDFDVHLVPLLKQGEKGKVIANLPYNVTTPILVKLVTLHPLFSHLVVMVQEEVARRFTAVPGTPDYSSFTVFLNYHSKPKYAFGVGRNCFYPAPRVDSAIVICALHSSPQDVNEERFFEMTRRAFEHRRKMLRSSLRELYAPEKVMHALENLGKSPQARPEELSLDEFIQLQKILLATEKSP